MPDAEDDARNCDPSSQMNSVSGFGHAPSYDNVIYVLRGEAAKTDG